jgi:hypothetical protein
MYALRIDELMGMVFSLISMIFMRVDLRHLPWAAPMLVLARSMHCTNRA